MTLSSGCSQPRVGLLTKLPWRVHSSPPSWPPSTRVFFPQLSLFISWEQTATGLPEPGLAPTPGTSAGIPGGPGSPGLLLAAEPRKLSKLAGLESFRLAILGKKEQRVVGLSSNSGESSSRGAAWLREEDREPGRDCMLAMDSTGEGRTPRLATASSGEETDSFRRWLYLLFCRRSMLETGEKGHSHPVLSGSRADAASWASQGPHRESECLQPPGSCPQAEASAEFCTRSTPARHGWQGELGLARWAAGPGAA